MNFSLPLAQEALDVVQSREQLRGFARRVGRGAVGGKVALEGVHADVEAPARFVKFLFFLSI